MKNIIFLILIIFIFLSSCKCSKIGHSTNIESIREVIVKEKILDTIIKGDTLYTTIQLECDSNKKVIVKNNYIKESDRQKVYFNLSDNNLNIKSICKDLELQIRSKDSIINSITKINTTQIIKESFFEKLKNNFFIILISLLIGFILGYLKG